MRVRSDAIATTARDIEFTFDGRPLRGLEAESIAAALTANGIAALRKARNDAARGLFCGMGVCFECLVSIDGQPGFRACMTALRDGMRIATQETLVAVSSSAWTVGVEDAIQGRSPEIPDVLVVGAGPAGLQAARAAALAGASVTMLDERPAPGGQYFKQLAKTHTAADGIDAQMREGAALIGEVRALGVTMHTDALVWGAFKPREICAMAAGRSRIFEPRALVLATGAYERGLPVPGWTLPGVMTTGAAQTLLRSYRVAPGSRVLIAGNGPLNLQLASELAAAGVEVVAVAESAARPSLRALRSFLPAAWHAPGLMLQGWRYLRDLSARGVPVLYRHVLVGAEGELRVRQATVTALDEQGHLRHGSSRRFEVDVVCMGYGFEPMNEIARALGCRHEFDPVRGALSARVDQDQASSISGIFIAGDGAGMSGARAAQEQGFIAGLAAARHAGHAASSSLTTELAVRRSRLRSHLRFQAALWSLFAAPQLHDQLAAPDTLICRCEEVSKAELARSLEAGLTMAGAVKRLTRAGMGRCQGRYCGPLIVRACAQASGRTIDELSGFAPRPPFKAMPIAALACNHPDPIASDGKPSS